MSSFIVAMILSASNAEPTLQKHSVKEPTGAICVGPDLSKAPPNPNIFIKVDDSEPKKFSGSAGEILFKKLLIKQKHTVQLLEGATPFETLEIDFTKLKTNFVVLWKAAGAWKVIAVGGEECKWPPPSCPKGQNCP